MGTPVFTDEGDISTTLLTRPASWLLRRREVVVDRTDMLSLEALRARELLMSVFSPGEEIKAKGARWT